MEHVVGDRIIRAILVAAVVIAALALDQSATLRRVDTLLFDVVHQLREKPTSPQVLVVAVDDASLQHLGRWPWSRQLQADLLDRLTQHQARAVGLDILFAEPQLDDSAADLALAAALRRNAHTVLAVAPGRSAEPGLISEILPLPRLASAAAALGHVDIEIDADGLCRSFYTHAGVATPHWRAFALAVLEVGGVTPADAGVPGPGTTGEGWRRYGRYYIPFDRDPAAVEQIPVYRLLNDPAVAERVRDRFVLVGSTAAGLGDVVSTPASFDRERMPGVVLNAHILSGLLQGGLVRDLAAPRQMLLTMLLAAIGAVVMVSTGFPLAVLLLFATVLAIVGFSAMLLALGHLWFAPAAAIAPLVAAFPLSGMWSLLRERRINASLTVRMQHQTLHHATTDLPNHYMLEQRLRELDSRNRSGLRAAALMIFHINWSESIGGLMARRAGDELLRAIAARLRGAVRSDDLVAHLNGDDFAILVEGIDDPKAVCRIADNLIAAIKQPFGESELAVYLAPRMGVSLWPSNSADGTALLRDAYIAMYRARVERAPHPCMYSGDIAREVEAHAQLERALLSAMDRGEFEVYYQPQVDPSGTRFIGVEALLRWHNPELGLVYPATFIPVAEHSGLIQEIGSWVLHTACRQVAEWHAKGQRALRLAVNLSPLQFVDTDLVGEVRSALAHSGLDPQTLELEITESALMHNMQDAIAIMLRLKKLGVKLALDDFGTGYSSLRHLQHFPLDRLKIDRSFTRELHDNADVREITLAIIGMAKRLHLGIIAEGVETDAQKQFLGEHGCDELQGYLFGHPVPALELLELLKGEGSFTDVERAVAAFGDWPRT